MFCDTVIPLSTNMSAEETPVKCTKSTDISCVVLHSETPEEIVDENYEDSDSDSYVSNTPWPEFDIPGIIYKIVQMFMLY